MARRCSLTGKASQFGNNVSHSNRKTRRRFQANIQKVSVTSEILGRAIPLRVTPATLRTIEHNGGLDNFLLTTSNLKLPEEARILKKRILKAKEKKAAA
ncbi:MAG: 50S ribosomal protein L28 [Alphaproteobacteria bacterium]|nr:50S ribosomal protein L28 [Alphaproteobacteria bacterium]